MKRFDHGFVHGIAVALASFGLVACSSSNGTSTQTNGTATGADASTSPDMETGFELDAALDGAPTSDAAIPSDGACGGSSMKATARDANVLLVLDKSGSMLQTPTGFSMKKWDAVKTALRDALGPVKNKLSLGLMMFPYDASGDIPASCTTNCCALPTGGAALNVAIEAGDTALDKILAAVDGTSPGGATPTAKALDEALTYFTTGAGKDLKGDKYVLLATDGGPNCNTELTCGPETCTTNIDGNCTAGSNCCDPSISKISCLDADAVVSKLGALKSAGVKTFVVGIPGSEAYKTYLDQFATAGGMTATGDTKYFAVAASGGTSGLTSTFSLITGELITTCKLQLESDPPDTAELNVYVDDKVVPQSGADGWSLDTSTSPPSIVLKGQTCDDVKTKGAKVISVVYGCPTIK